MYGGAFSSRIPAKMDIVLMEAIGIRKGVEVAKAGGITHWDKEWCQIGGGHVAFFLYLYV